VYALSLVLINLYILFHIFTNLLITHTNEQFDFFDPGFPLQDACYDPTKPIGQGSFRAQIDGFLHGKGIRIKQASYQTK
jgi:hypothetical protein